MFEKTAAVNKTKTSALSFIVKFIRFISTEYAIVYAAVILFVILCFASKVFLSTTNIMNILRQTSMIAILSVGMYFVMVGGGIDISVGSLVGLCSIAFAAAMVWWKWHWIIAIFFTFGVGALAGSINGVLTAYIGMPAFISTLAMMSVARGLVYVVTQVFPILGIPQQVDFIGRGYLYIIPIPVIIMLIVYLLAHFVTRKAEVRSLCLRRRRKRGGRLLVRHQCQSCPNYNLCNMRLSRGG